LNDAMEQLDSSELSTVVEHFCRLLALACGGPAGDQRDAVRAAKLRQAKEYIALHLSEPDLSPASVAAAIKISVRQLHLLFEPTGTSFAQHVLAKRLEECCSAPDESIEPNPVHHRHCLRLGFQQSPLVL
jgi:hypothetical protein